MTTYVYSTVAGLFVFDENHSLVKKQEITLHDARQLTENKVLVAEREILQQEKKNPVLVSEKEIWPSPVRQATKSQKRACLSQLKSIQYFPLIRERSIRIAKEKIKSATTEEFPLIPMFHFIEDLQRTIAILTKRLREQYTLYAPEVEQVYTEHEVFVKQIQQHTKKELLGAIHCEQSMGADLSEEVEQEMKDTAKHLTQLYDLKEKKEKELEQHMQRVCPNITTVAGVMIAASLLAHAGSLEKMAKMPASTIQLLGAEKALFRHLRTGARPPRHGIIVKHPLIANSPNKEHGKRARVLADKISIASRIDFFKGKYRGDVLKKELEEKYQPYS